MSPRFSNSLSRLAAAAAVVLALASAAPAHAAGTLTPVSSPEAPIQIRDHDVQVVINNGFARTRVTQTFFNPNAADLEGIYAFPVPRSASLSELVITSGEKEIHGEVIDADEAKRIYGEEKSQGNDAGLAEKNGYQTFEFRVSPIRAQSETRVTFVYYQPLEIDTGIARYLYPLENGGTDELAKTFWLANEKVEGTLSVEVELKSAWPVEEVRAPGFESEAQVEKLESGHYRLKLERQGALLDRDFVFYYRLANDLPGRVELVPYRPDPSKPGTFMMVVTPGLDLKPITGGADYVFVLDISGSMAGKIATLAHGVSKALGEMDPSDRFRVVVFESSARELTRDWVAATPDNVQRWAQQIAKLEATGSTNLYDGLSLGLRNLDDDRATSVVLVTDGVTNTGVVDPKKFHELMKRYDVRLFGFLMGNSANWPLMRVVTEASGGFYAPVSNADDVIGQILLAKSKIRSEALHDAEFSIQGVKAFDTTGAIVGKVYRGQQLVLFGRYDGSGPAELTLKARLTGQDRTYHTRFDFPETETENPEIERLWALARIEEIETRMQAGLLDVREGSDAVRDLGVAYQIVTDETSMIALDDAAFERHGIERRNRTRTALEHAAQDQRAAAPIRQRRVDVQQPLFDRPAPHLGSGAIDPALAALALGLAALAALRGRRAT